MTCQICGRQTPLHGSSLPGGTPGTHLNESGCHDGVWMDDDEYHEGWQPDVIYRPCPQSPQCCKACGGDGRSRDPKHDSDDCAECDGTGWKGADPQWPAAAEPEQETTMTEAQIKYMVDRFLSWKLPRDTFNPDCGISFDKEPYNTHTPYPSKHEPSGTNLFDAQQATAMVRHMIEGMPDQN